MSKKKFNLLLAFVIFLSAYLLDYLQYSQEYTNASSPSPFKTPSVNQTVLSATTSPSASSSSEFTVIKIIDGDTIQLEGGIKVRYIGIDTPETVDPKREVGCFGKEASAKNAQLVLGKKVKMEKDVNNTDRYGRLLRYVYVTGNDNLETIMVNNELVKTGYAKAATFPPDVKYQTLFAESEKYARENGLGLWGNCL